MGNYSKLGQLITSSLELDDILENLRKEVETFLNPDHWALLKIDEDTEELSFLYEKNTPKESLKRTKLQFGEGIAGMVAKSGNPIMSPDVRVDSRFSKKIYKNIGIKPQSVIAVPILYRRDVYGILEAVNSVESPKFSSEDLQTLFKLADFTAIALTNSSLYEKAMNQTNYDALTGLLNRNKLEQLIKEWTSKNLLRREGDSYNYIEVIYIDINDFKEVNDNYGHQEGDRVLIYISARLASIFRSEDYLFRIGGDEFLAIMREPEKSSVADKRIKKSLSELKYKGKKGMPEINLSFGTAHGKRKDIKDLIVKADREMYKAKSKKKTNKVYAKNMTIPV